MNAAPHPELRGLPLRLAVLDLAGTTVDATDEVTTALADVFSAAGFTVGASSIAAVRGRHKRDAIVELLAGLAPDQGRVVPPDPDTLYAAFRRRLIERYTRRPVRPIAGAEETVQWLLDRGVSVALTTGFDRVVVDLLLDQIGWSRSFVSTIVCSDDVPRGRPAPDMIRHAMRAAGVEDAATVLVVGDTPADLQAARAAGAWSAVAVLSGAGTTAALAAEHPTAILQSVADLPRWLEGVEQAR